MILRNNIEQLLSAQCVSFVGRSIAPQSPFSAFESVVMDDCVLLAFLSFVSALSAMMMKLKQISLKMNEIKEVTPCEQGTDDSSHPSSVIHIWNSDL